MFKVVTNKYADGVEVNTIFKDDEPLIVHWQTPPAFLEARIKAGVDSTLSEMIEMAYAPFAKELTTEDWVEIRKVIDQHIADKKDSVKPAIVEPEEASSDQPHVKS